MFKHNGEEIQNPKSYVFKLRKALFNQGVDPSLKLYVQRVPDGTEKATLRRYFEHYGSVTSVDIVKNTWKSGRDTDKAYIVFQESGAVDAALKETEKHQIKGKRITVRSCHLDHICLYDADKKVIPDPLQWIVDKYGKSWDKNLKEESSQCWSDEKFGSSWDEHLSEETSQEKLGKRWHKHSHETPSQDWSEEMFGKSWDKHLSEESSQDWNRKRFGDSKKTHSRKASSQDWSEDKYCKPWDGHPNDEPSQAWSTEKFGKSWDMHLSNEASQNWNEELGKSWDKHLNEEPKEDEHVAMQKRILKPLFGVWFVWRKGNILEVKAKWDNDGKDPVLEVLYKVYGKDPVLQGAAAQKIWVHGKDAYLDTLVLDKEESSNTRIVWKDSAQDCSSEVWFDHPEKCRQEDEHMERRFDGGSYEPLSPFLKPLLGDWYVFKEGKSVKINVSYQIGNEYEGNLILETLCEVGESQRIWLQDREVYLEKLVLDTEACSASRIVWKVPKQACCHEVWYRDSEKCRPEPVEDVERHSDSGDHACKNPVSMSPFLKPLLGDWYVCKQGNSLKITVGYQIGNEYEGNPILETSCEVGESQRIWLQDREVYLEKLVLDKGACSASRIVWKVPKQAWLQEIWFKDLDRCRREHKVLEDDDEERHSDHAEYDWNNPESLSPLLMPLLGDWFISKEGKSVKITVSYEPGNECKGAAVLKASYEGDACQRIWFQEKDVFLEKFVLDKEACSMTRIVWKLPEQVCPYEIWHRDSECRSELEEDEHVERNSDRENTASLLPILAPLIGDWYIWYEGRCLEIKVSCQSGQQVLGASCEGSFQVIQSIEGDVYLEETLIQDKETSSVTRIVWKAIRQGCRAEVWYKDHEECRREHEATLESALQPLVGRWNALLLGKNVEIVVTSDIDENGEHSLQANCETMKVCRTVKLWSRRIVLDDLYILDKTNSKNKHVIWQDITDFRPMETWKRADDQEWKAEWLSDEQEWKTGLSDSWKDWQPSGAHSGSSSSRQDHPAVDQRSWTKFVKENNITVHSEANHHEALVQPSSSSASNVVPRKAGFTFSIDAPEFTPIIGTAPKVTLLSDALPEFTPIIGTAPKEQLLDAALPAALRKNSAPSALNPNLVEVETPVTTQSQLNKEAPVFTPGGTSSLLNKWASAFVPKASSCDEGTTSSSKPSALDEKVSCPPSEAAPEQVLAVAERDSTGGTTTETQLQASSVSSKPAEVATYQVDAVAEKTDSTGGFMASDSSSEVPAVPQSEVPTKSEWRHERQKQKRGEVSDSSGRNTPRADISGSSHHLPPPPPPSRRLNLSDRPPPPPKTSHDPPSHHSSKQEPRELPTGGGPVPPKFPPAAPVAPPPGPGPPPPRAPPVVAVAPPPRPLRPTHGSQLPAFRGLEIENAAHLEVLE